MGSEPQRYHYVADDSGHHYYIPVEKSKEWELFCEFDDDDERGWDVPEWAVRINGTFSFTDPRCD